MIAALRTVGTRIKRHPIVAWILAVVPIAGLSFGIANAWYSSVINEYRAQLDGAQAEIRKLRDQLATHSVEETAASKSARSEQKAISEVVLLEKDKPAFLFNNQWRLEYKDTGVREAGILFHFGSEWLRPTLSLDRRTTIAVNGRQVFLDLLEVNSFSARLRVTSGSSSTSPNP